jgi:hypothetical protein
MGGRFQYRLMLCADSHRCLLDDPSGLYATASRESDTLPLGPGRLGRHGTQWQRPPGRWRVCASRAVRQAFRLFSKQLV